MDTKKDDIVTEGFEAAEMIAQKATHRAEIDAAREVYLDAGGTIKKFIPPFDEKYFIHCDMHEPGEGAYQSHAGVQETFVRKPRPPKKFGSKR